MTKEGDDLRVWSVSTVEGQPPLPLHRAVGWVVAAGPQLLPAFHHLLTGLIATQHGGGFVQQMYSVGYAFTVR